MKRSLVISGGVHKGMRITCPPGEIRPAMSVMRKILFQVLANMLMNRDDEQREDRMNAHKAFDGLSVVDMFSGSGLMALEFISRGATHALAVESDSRKWSTVLANIATLRSGAEKYAKTVFLYKDKVERFIVKHKKTHDIIYCDPPFAYAHKGDLLHKIAASTLIGARSIVVIHSPTCEKLSDYYAALHKVDVRTIGSSAVHFYALR